MTSIHAVGDKSANRSPLIPFELDGEGFLLDKDAWSEQTASLIADIRGVGPLTGKHWSVIHFVRERYTRLGAVAPIRSICRSNALSREEVKVLFGSCLDVWRIAGLPDPGEEAKSYMS